MIDLSLSLSNRYLGEWETVSTRGNNYERRQLEIYAEPAWAVPLVSIRRPLVPATRYFHRVNYSRLWSGKRFNRARLNLIVGGIFNRSYDGHFFFFLATYTVLDAAGYISNEKLFKEG